MKRVVKVAFFNQKGGTGKTTTSVNVAHLWAQSGKRVLLIDLDSQGNVGESLGLERTNALHRFLISDAGTGAIARSGRDNLAVILGDKTTAKTKQILSGDPFGVFKLREAVDAISSRYDAIIFDVAPSADILQLAALVACTHFVIPVELEHLAMVGVADAMESVASLKKVNAFQGGFAGVLPTKLDLRYKSHPERLRLLAETFGRQVMPPIPTDGTVGKAHEAQRTLLEFDPLCNAMRGIELRDQGRGRIGGYIAAARWLAEEVGL